MKKMICLLIVLILAFQLPACSDKTSKYKEGETETQTEPEISQPTTQEKGNGALMSNLAIELGITNENYPKIDGSTSTLPIVQEIYNTMYRSNLGSEYPETASKTVPSYQRLINNEVDMIIVPYASSDVLETAEEAKVTLEFHPIAAEALVFITPIENTANNITKEQVRDIYLNYGIKSWSELGGADKELVPICRNADSGSQSQMDNLILNDQDMHPKIKDNYVELTMEGMLEQVAYYHNGGLDGKPTNSYALGYTLFNYIKMIGDITGIHRELKILSFDGIAPTEESISNGTYPLSDGYYVVVREDLPKEHSARKIIKWIQSGGGKDMIKRAGFIPKINK